jgi:hypothetical protein
MWHRFTSPQDWWIHHRAAAAHQARVFDAHRIRGAIEQEEAKLAQLRMEDEDLQHRHSKRPRTDDFCITDQQILLMKRQHTELQMEVRNAERETRVAKVLQAALRRRLARI